ncbi:sodium/potassium-transporting ATPase subunit beta-1 isoform X1 [Monomorium pharaonis]|uniref:sodium/potassium-transporting ATPase subunit beta-1 isoform X1 n=1 Tax=Monomorium pharaonis TaxID=307658 RepID=UPI00102E1828|nr:sodium/potassium-transporting ATPase subunit beta-1 isoform X1 [Monomorium pharaonis]XP_036145230.1 sodium/potassium-transporting ATPase subunit beta-1 isoform X1 [Monomorium pharaonis]
MVILHDDEYYRNRVPEPDLGALRNFRRFVWNPDRRQLLGRSGKEWALLGLFYFCFFTVLGSLFVLQMWISIDYASKLERPFFLYSGLTPRSYFGSNFPLFRQLNFDSPGIAFKPNILLAKKSPIIWVDNSSANARPKRYVEALSDFLQEYNKSKEKYNTFTECNDGISIGSSTRTCFFDIETLGVCGQPPYGYTDPLQPCVLIKFNKRFNWVPIPYNKSSHLPENMPHALQKIIQFSNKFQIWLWCDGVNNVDKEHIGEIEYFPSPGFSVQYFPFVGQPDYLAPLVALRFKNISSFRLITVECSLWALNINKNAQNALDFQIILGEP